MVKVGEGVLVKGRPKDDGSGSWWDVYHPGCAPDTEDWSQFRPSAYQGQLHEAWTQGCSHLVVNAVAGSGKTTTIVWLLSTTRDGFAYELGRDPRIAFTCFNVTIKDELKARVPPESALVVTLNGLGHRVVARFLRGNGVEVEVDKDKAWRHTRLLLPGNIRQLRELLRKEDRPVPANKGDLAGWRGAHLLLAGEAAPEDLAARQVMRKCEILLERNFKIQGPVKKLVDLSRATISHDYARLVQRYSIDGLGDDVEVAFASVPLVLGTMEHEALETGVIDYDEQLWLPHIWEIGPQPMDLVAVDEAQDVNEVQLELLLKTAKGGRLVFVGDSAQAIYGFRGAGVGMISRIRDALAETERSVSEIPLSICYRCPLSVLELVRRIGHVTEIEPRPGALLGVIREADRDGAWWEGCDPAALVLCRTNAPLAEAYFKLIAAGVKATIRGRSEGGIFLQLVEMIDRLAPPSGSLVTLIENAFSHEEQEIPKLVAAGNEQGLVRLADLVELIVILSDGVGSLRELRNRIETAFVHDNEKSPGVTLSTVHKAKGLEAQEVFILEPHLIPWPGSVGWEKVQEKNLEYVAYTRTQGTLTFIGRVPSEAFDSGGTGLVDGPLLERGQVEEDLWGEEDEEMPPVSLLGLDLASLPTWKSKGDGSFAPPRSMEDWQSVLDKYEAAGIPARASSPRGWGLKVALTFAGCVRVSACLQRTSGGHKAIKKDAGAIDVVPIHEGEPVGPSRRVLRKAGWKGRAAARINAALRDLQRRARREA